MKQHASMYVRCTHSSCFTANVKVSLRRFHLFPFGLRRHREGGGGFLPWTGVAAGHQVGKILRTRRQPRVSSVVHQLLTFVTTHEAVSSHETGVWLSRARRPENGWCGPRCSSRPAARARVPELCQRSREMHGNWPFKCLQRLNFAPRRREKL